MDGDRPNPQPCAGYCLRCAHHGPEPPAIPGPGPARGGQPVYRCALLQDYPIRRLVARSGHVPCRQSRGSPAGIARQVPSDPGAFAGFQGRRSRTSSSTGTPGTASTLPRPWCCCCVPRVSVPAWCQASWPQSGTKHQGIHCANQGHAHVGGSPGRGHLGPLRPDAQFLPVSIADHEYPGQRSHGLVPERRHV